jgi:hypothetical protein
MNASAEIMDTVRDLCFEAALWLVLERRPRWAFLIDQAAELLAERSRCLGVRTSDSIKLPMGFH